MKSTDPTSTLPRPGTLRKSARRFAALLSLALATSAATAAQTLAIRDGDTTVVRVSLRDQTRVRVAGGRIVEVIGDVHDPKQNPAGRIAVLRDEADGEVYLKPVPGAAGTSPVKLDVKTTLGTVGLLLQPAEIVADTLTLRITGGPAVALAAKADPLGNARGAGYVRSLKALTLALAAPELAPELAAQVLPIGHEIALWKEARFVLRARLDSAGLRGESFELTNISAQPMVIDERELFRDGVLSVAVRRLLLEPGESTAVWIVRRAADPD